MKKHKKILFTGLFLILVLLLILFLFIPKQKQEEKSANQNNTITEINSVNIIQKVYISSGEVKENNVSINKGATALDMLQNTLQVSTNGKGEEAYVTSIDNVKADSKKKQYWSFYVNKKQSQVGAGSYKLRDGDLIEWKLEEY